MMRRFDRRMNSSATPDKQWFDPVLGEMCYCEDDETWVGCFNGFEYRIACLDETCPDEVLLSYCREVLAEPEVLLALLERHKQGKLGCHGGCFDEEIEQLTYLNLMFYRSSDSLRILAQLSAKAPLHEMNSALSLVDEDDERLWRLECFDGRWQALDFEY